MDPGTVIDALSPIHMHFAAAAHVWFPTLIAAANWVFSVLVIVEVITYIIAHGPNAGMFWALFTDRILKILAFKLILVNAGWIIPAALNGFVEVSTRASGVEALNPAQIAERGIFLAARLCFEMFSWSFWLHPLSILFGFFAAAGIALSYFVIASTLCLAMIEGYIVCGAGVFLLGFGGWSGTSAITQRYLSYIVGIGTKLFMIYLLVGAGDTLAHLWAGMIRDVTVENFSTLIMLFMGVGAFGLIVWFIPSLVSSLLTGAVGMGPIESIRTTVEVSRIAMSAAGGGIGAIGATGSLYGLGRETSRQLGGGMRGLSGGLGAMISAGGRELAYASAPRLSQGAKNLQQQRQDLKGKP